MIVQFLPEGKICNNLENDDTYLSFVVVVEVVVIFRLIRIQRLVYPLTLSFIPNISFQNVSIQKYHIESLLVQLNNF